MGSMCYKTFLNSENQNEELNFKDFIVNQGMLVRQGESSPLNNYKYIKSIGEGSFATVYKCLHKPTNTIRALKKIDKNIQLSSEEEILNEIDILKKMDHINILRIYEFYITSDFFYLITEYCNEGELFDHLTNDGPFDESHSAYIIYQLLSAIYFCHSSNIIHRDLKPENILVESINTNKGEGNCKYLNVKIIDFGAAKIFEKNKKEVKQIGSCYYMAPEVLKKSYTEKCDLFSVGVILYMLLSGIPPFDGDTEKKIFFRILEGEYDLKTGVWTKISKEAKNLIKLLLEHDPNKRISAKAAINHEWFKIQNTKELLFNCSNGANTMGSMLNTISSYKSDFKLQQVAIAFIVHNMTQTEEVKEIYSIFRQLDDNGDGRITKDELVLGMKLYNKTQNKSVSNIEEEVDNIFKLIDTDKNGYLEFEECVRVLIDKKKLLTDENLKFSFNFFDKDGSGEITIEELKEIFGVKNNSEIEKLVQEIDIDGDKTISFEEYKIMMRKIIDN